MTFASKWCSVWAGGRPSVRLVAWAIGLLILGCGEGGEGLADRIPSSVDVPSLEFVLSSGRVPPSLNAEIELISPTGACLIDSYQVRVVCARDRGWTDTTVIGSEGEGPGEYEKPGSLTLIRGEGIAVTDLGTGRIQIFTLGGDLVRAVRDLPSGFHPLSGPMEHKFVGTYIRRGASEWAAPVAWIPLEGGKSRRLELFTHESEATRRSMTVGVPAAARQPGEGFVFWLGGDYTLARYSSGGSLIEEFTSPVHEPERPDQRDVAAFQELIKGVTGRFPPPDAIERYREQPVPPLVQGEPLHFDGVGRLWVATTRDHVEQSYFDVFEEGDYLGSVEVTDRLLAFDIHGATLAALVEDDETDAVGLYPRRIDWYRIK